MINGLEESISKEIVAAILSYKKVEKIVLFGSRTTGAFKKGSDIDIAIFAKDWSSRDFNLVKHLLDEKINTPLKFDIINFYSLTKERLKRNILSKGRLIYEHRAD